MKPVQYDDNSDQDEIPVDIESALHDFVDTESQDDAEVVERELARLGYTQVRESGEASKRGW